MPNFFQKTHLDCCKNVCLSRNDACRAIQSLIPWFLGPSAKVLLADAFGELAHVEVGRFGTAVHQRFSKEKPGA